MFQKLICFALIVSAVEAFAKKQSSQASKKPRTTIKFKTIAPEQRLQTLKSLYRQGEISDKKMWSELAGLSKETKQLSTSARAILQQSQAHMLLEGGYPIAAAAYAARAILIFPNPLDKEIAPSWQVLASVAKKQAIQNILEGIAGEIDVSRGKVPEFGNDWHYFVGSAADRRGEKELAVEAYGKLTIADRYFMPGKYLQAMIQIERNHHKDGEIALKSIVYPETSALSSLRRSSKAELDNYARMALGRLYYEQQEFVKAIKMYRSVDRNSALFYDALFEQSWAFFMGGYPNHSLGSLYSVESPFFKQEFNPEATVLRAIVNYWMCRYDDSREALADFMDVHANAVESLTTFLDRQQLREESAYHLFENYISGVSEDALGIPRNILATAATKDSMLLVRDQYASVIEEREKLAIRGVYKTKEGTDKALEHLAGLAESLRKDIGEAYLDELKAMKEQFNQLYSQAQFLYLELLMSEKEQLLGRELHASSKIARVSMKKDVAGWGKRMQSWAASDKDEYWWDEIGFYISRAQPMCSVP